MGIFVNLLCRYALRKADMTGDTFRKLLVLYNKAVVSLKVDWDKSVYNDLENARRMAEEQNHWFEELLILVTEEECLYERHKDRELYYTANSRLKELHKVFDMSDAEFRTVFEENYVKGRSQKVQALTSKLLVQLYDSLYVYADYMTAHLNYMAGLLCSKAMGKIEMLTGNIAFEDRMERLFKMAGDYGSIQEVDNAMLYYNEAIKVAREEKDETYEYIALMRKMSICLSAEHMANHVNLDAETMSAIARLNEMCDGNHMDPYALGEKLMEAELEKAETGTMAEKKKAKRRVDRLRESMPMIYLQLALSRGDWQTARIYSDELKKKEMEAYGSCSGFSNSDMMMPTYAMLYDSEERNEAAEQSVAGDEEDTDEPYQCNFPQGMFPLDKYRFLTWVIGNEIRNNHLQAAVALSKQAKEIASEMYSDYHVAMSLHAMGQAYQIAGKDDEALEYYQSVVKILTGSAHPGSDATLSKYLLYITLLAIGILTKDTRPEESISVLSEAAELLASKKNNETLFLENTLLTRAKAKANAGDVEGKETDCQEALCLIVGEARKRLPFIDKELRENYWANVSVRLRQVVALVDEASSSSLRLAVYEAILMAKGFLLSSEKAEKKAVSNEKSLREYIPLYKELEDYEASKLPWGTMTENSAGKYVGHYLKSMKLQMATNGVIEKYYDFMHIGYGDVAKALDEKEVVLDFYDYPLGDGDQQYVAFVYRKGMESPAFVRACRESDLQKVFQEVAACRYDDGTPFHVSEAYNAARPYSAQLYNLILDGALKQAQPEQDGRICFVPSGSLHKIPVESLVMTEGTETTVTDHYARFTRISHVRTLMDPDDSGLDSAVLFGGLDYGADDAPESSSRGYIIGREEREPTPLMPWGKLQCTMKEVRNISFLWKMAKGVDAKVLTGLDGTPEKFKEMSEKGCSVLHLATHGFFETKKSMTHIPGLQGAFRPMDLTGLVMSNGNEGWLHGCNTHHEGILTAADIARMDLGQTRLVVLSACYTGDGDVRSDGVFGLQRAFKKAGAGSIVMSLWNESDDAGALFMSVFYSHLLRDEMDRREAFRQAREETRRKFPHPLFWANFILID